MSTTAGDLSVFLQLALGNTGITSYLGAAKQGATYPLITHNIISSNTLYTLPKEDGSWDRVDRFIIQIGIYGTSVANTFDTLSLVEAEIEGQKGIQINDSALLCIDRINTIGPRWLGKEGYYQLIVQMEAKMAVNSNQISPIPSGSRKLVYGSTAITMSSLELTVPLTYGFIPTQVIVNVNKPTINDSTFFASVIKDSISATEFKVTLSGIPEKTGYTLDWIIMK